MRVYHGQRTPDGCRVTVDGAPLRVRSDLSGAIVDFDWGYVGNPQLSLALLSDLLHDSQKAMALCEGFDREVVALLPRDGWTVTEERLARAVAELEAGQVSGPAESARGGLTRPDDRGGTVGFGDMPVLTGGLVPHSASEAEPIAGDLAQNRAERGGHVAFGDMPIAGPDDEAR